MASNSNPAEIAPGLVKPVSGATLFRKEVQRRKKLYQRGVVSTGCPEIDDTLLLGGGFERGCVVGVSAEEADFGVLLGLQTIARALIFGNPNTSGNVGQPRAAIITTLPVTTILPILRDVIRSQIRSNLGTRDNGIDAELRRGLEAVSISRIFDIEGFWEVLDELGEAQHENNLSHTIKPDNPNKNRGGEPESEATGIVKNLVNEEIKETNTVEAATGQEEAGLVNARPLVSHSEPLAPPREPVTELPPLRVGPELEPLVRKSEILDSEDEEPFSSSPLSSPPPSTAAPESSPPFGERSRSPADPDPNPTPPRGSAEPESQLPKAETPPLVAATVPDIILVTHFTPLLTTLFTHDQTLAHASLQRLASRLRDLTRSAVAGPLIMLLNTTTTAPPIPVPSSSSASRSTTTPITATTATTTTRSPAGPEQQLQHQQQQQHQRLPDSTLRSIFAGPTRGNGSSSSSSSRPSYGATFAQLLDLHLLCTRVPRTADDAAAAAELGARAGPGDVGRVWVVEALLDEMGVHDWSGAPGDDDDNNNNNNDDDDDDHGDDGLPPRVFRERRWAAVDVRDGVRVVDAFRAAK